MKYGDIYDLVPENCPYCGSKAVDVKDYHADVIQGPRQVSNQYLPPVVAGEHITLVCKNAKCLHPQTLISW